MFKIDSICNTKCVRLGKEVRIKHVQTYLRRDETENSERFCLTVLLLGHTGWDLPQNFDAFTIFPPKDFYLADPEGVLWALQFNFDYMIIPARKLTCHPAHVAWIKINLGKTRHKVFPGHTVTFKRAITAVQIFYCTCQPITSAMKNIPAWFCRGLL